MSQLVTGEAVVLQVRIARMPTRALACAIDVLLQGVVLMVLISLLAGFLLGGESSEALAVALIFIVVLLVVIGYRVVMETLTRGRTLGKMVLGLKVVRDDGSSIRFRHALVRTLFWVFVDFAPWFAAGPGIVASLMNKQGKRIGDMVSGTVVIRERHQPMASPPLFVPGHLVQWAQSLELSRLPDDLANTARDYLARFTELQPDARTALGDAVAARVATVTAPAPPVPLIAPAYLSAVLAERRRRELTRLSTLRRLPTGPFPAPSYVTAFPTPASYGTASPTTRQYGAPLPASYGTAFPTPASYGTASPTTRQYGAPLPASPASYGNPAPAPPHYGNPAAAPAYRDPAATPTPSYAIPPGPFAPPSPYGALPPAPPPPPGPFAPPQPAGTPRLATVNPQGWAAPGSNEPTQWF